MRMAASVAIFIFGYVSLYLRQLKQIYMHYENLNLENIEGEIWMPIPKFEGVYEASNMGRVKSLSREIRVDYGNIGSGTLLSDTFIMKQTVHVAGYLVLTLTDNTGYGKSRRVHRLIGLSFLPNPEHKPTVDHLDTNKKNNVLSNLRWATQKEQSETNAKHGIIQSKEGADHAQSKTVYHYSTKGQLIATYGSCGEAHRLSGVSVAHINKICRKEFDFVGENVFSYEELPREYFNREFKKRTQKERIVIKYDLMLNELERYFNCNEAAEKNNLQYTGIHCAAIGKTKTCGEFKWKYANENE